MMSKEGSTISGLMDAFATSISIALQYGVPLRVLVTSSSTPVRPGHENNPRSDSQNRRRLYLQISRAEVSLEGGPDALGLARTMVETMMPIEARRTDAEAGRTEDGGA